MQGKTIEIANNYSMVIREFLRNVDERLLV